MIIEIILITSTACKIFLGPLWMGATRFALVMPAGHPSKNFVTKVESISSLIHYYVAECKESKIINILLFNL